MAENDVTFLAFGQDHRNGQWLKDLTVKIKEMRDAKVAVILCNEHGPDTDARSQLEMAQKKFVGASYFEACHQNGATPNLQDFISKNPRFPAAVCEQIYKPIEAARLAAGGWANCEYAGRAPAYEAEIELYQFAVNERIMVRGLDHPDKERVYKKSMGDDRSEFPRIDHMSSEALGLAQMMARNGGGVIVACNMGASHMGNLQVSLMKKVEEAKNHGQLHGAEVHVRCAVVLDPANGVAKGIGNTPVDGQRSMQSGTERILAHANSPFQAASPMQKQAAEQDVAELEISVVAKKAEVDALQKRLDEAPERVQTLKDMQNVMGLSEDEVRDVDTLRPLLQEYCANSFLSGLDKKLEVDPAFGRITQDLEKCQLPASDPRNVAARWKQETRAKLGAATNNLEKLEGLLEARKNDVENFGRDLQQEVTFAEETMRYLQSIPLNDGEIFYAPDNQGAYKVGLDQQLDPLKESAAFKHPPPAYRAPPPPPPLDQAPMFPGPPSDQASQFPPPPSHMAPPIPPAPPPEKIVIGGQQPGGQAGEVVSTGEAIRRRALEFKERRKFGENSTAAKAGLEGNSQAKRSNLSNSRGTGNDL